MKIFLKILDSAFFQNLIICTVLFNALVLGLLVSGLEIVDSEILVRLDEYCLWFFMFEIGFKLVVLNKNFGRTNWNYFDLAVIAISAFPMFSFFSVLRVLRILKVVRLVSVFPQFRFVLAIISHSLPNMLCLGALLVVIYYVYGVLGVGLFGEIAPSYFENLGVALYTLFQIMTGDSWSEAVARPILEQMPRAWMYFVSYIVVVSFVVLNIVIGIIVDSTNEIRELRV